jgi:hypothetical protein
MQYQYIPYIWPLFASAFVSLPPGVYACSTVFKRIREAITASSKGN